MITETFSESDQAASARSVYLALTELASDFGSDTFTATKALIAHKAGLSYSSVQRLLKGLEQLGVVRIQRGRINGLLRTANTYTLLSDSSLGHGDLSIGIGVPQLNPDKVKEKEKKRKKQSTCVRTTQGARATAKAVLVSEDSKKTCKQHVKEEAPAERGYMIHGNGKGNFVDAEIANRMFANNPSLKFTPAIKRGDVIEDLERSPAQAQNGEARE